MSTTVHIVDMLTQVGQCENTRGETLLASPNRGTEEHCIKVSSQIPQGRLYFEKTGQFVFYCSTFHLQLFVVFGFQTNWEL